MPAPTVSFTGGKQQKAIPANSGQRGFTAKPSRTRGIGCKPEKGTGNSRNQGSSRDQEEGPDQAQSKLAWTEGTQPQPVSESVALRGGTCEPRLGRACTWLGKAGDGLRPTAQALGKGTPAEQHPLQHPANPTPPALSSPLGPGARALQLGIRLLLILVTGPCQFLGPKPSVL